MKIVTEKCEIYAFFINLLIIQIKSVVVNDSNIIINENRIRFNINNKKLNLYSKNNLQNLLSGNLANLIDYSNYEIENKSFNDSHKLLKLKHENGDSIEFTVKSSLANNITCTSFQWSFKSKVPKRYNAFEDCFQINSSFWYGGSEMYGSQYWPINKQVYMQL